MENNELIRGETLTFLALRPSLQFTKEMIYNELKRSIAGLTPEGVANALAYLEAKQHIDNTKVPLGTTRVFTVTPTGLEAYENAQI
jgi:DNA-binding HxlR family transcriptional regulator